MFCVVQEVKRRKPARQGDYREYKVNTFTIGGITYAGGNYGGGYQESDFSSYLNPKRNTYSAEECKSWIVVFAALPAVAGTIVWNITKKKKLDDES